MKYALEDFVYRYTLLRREHSEWTNQAIANEMQMTRGALDKALERARAKGHHIPAAGRGVLGPRKEPPLPLRVRVALEVKDVRTRPGWNKQAACRYDGLDDDRFIPEGRVRATSRVVQDVKDEFCAGCPVTDDCLVTGLQDPRLIGIWGGMLLPHQIDEVNVDKLKAKINER